ncbi:MAG: undecaprenyl/decaprenyl-phosphate alpha-N-acetylglucosaminyl 1-phosphate transferase [Anaerolineae bacterium]|jgi:UDP-GlcNAc:undecaprenyl-phosphate GlcNAc-1-phosphate transferase|nr:undecaprenyl/decaprenyl-phosphate alpha-N-acetylglucosaminyl 1-phosphate transferase [Anaerolineae bacterium]
MPQYLPGFLIVFAVAFLVALSITPIARRIGSRLDVQDRPDGRRRHRGVIPRTGGVAMYAGFMAAIVVMLLLPPSLGGQALFPPRLDPGEATRLAGLLIGVTAIFAFGLADDRFDLTARQQYAGQLISALIAIAFTIWIQKVNNPFTNEQIVFPWPVVGLFTILWFTGMMNTVNWLDGLDGLAAGVSCIVAAFICIHMLREGQLSVALLPLALVGATLGFLPFNFNPAKIFMGSGGSYFLGWTVAALGIIGGAKVATVLLAMGLPILDVAWLIYSRTRHHGRPGIPGRDHLHHRLLDIGFTQRQIVLAYYAFCAIFGALALLLENRLYKVIALAVLGAAAFAVLVWAARQPAGKYVNGRPAGRDSA